MFDMSALTMGEITQIEELTGMPFTALSDDSAPKGKLFTAVILLAKRRTDPSFSWSQAEAVPLTEMNKLLGAEEEDPKATQPDAPALETSHSSS